jgi:hypothetical protein
MLRVPLVGAGTPDDPHRPDLPAGTGYTITERHGDGTVTVTFDAGTEALIELRRDVAPRLAAAERPEHVREWTMPTGAHDAPNVGDHRWHDGQVWRSLIVGNTTVPGSDPRWWEPVAPPAVPDVLRKPLAALKPQVDAAANVTQLRAAVRAILDVLAP